MAIIKQLQPDEYSDARKKALIEISKQKTLLDTKEGAFS